MQTNVACVAKALQSVCNVGSQGQVVVSFSMFHTNTT